MTKIVSRVRKLLALSKSSNVHEAAVAAAHAQQLIEKYRLENVDIHEPDSDPWTVALDDDPLDQGARFAQWKVDLAMVVTETNACRVVVFQQGRYSTIKIVGAPAEVEVCRTLYTWLCSEIQRLARSSKQRGRASIDSFRQGAIRTIEDEISRVNIRTRCDFKETGASLVHVRQSTKAMCHREERAEELQNEITDGEETYVGHDEDDFDADAFCQGAALGKLIDMSGYREKLSAKA